MDEFISAKLGYMLLPDRKSVGFHTSSQPMEGAEKPLPGIPRDNLALEYDGHLNTYPECMIGVPVARIDWNHPYWEPEWQDICEFIEARVHKYKTGSSTHAKRQVLRGTKPFGFLNDEAQISPYQLLGKTDIPPAGASSLLMSFSSLVMRFGY